MEYLGCLYQRCLFTLGLEEENGCLIYRVCCVMLYSGSSLAPFDSWMAMVGVHYWARSIKYLMIHLMCIHECLNAEKPSSCWLCLAGP
jgi:ABC-type xylose transport system permease subunit